MCRSVLKIKAFISMNQISLHTHTYVLSQYFIMLLAIYIKPKSNKIVLYKLFITLSHRDRGLLDPQGQ